MKKLIVFVSMATQLIKNAFECRIVLYFILKDENRIKLCSVIYLFIHGKKHLKHVHTCFQID